jgi:hypothetical protein
MTRLRRTLVGLVAAMSVAAGAPRGARADTPPDVWSRARDPNKKSNFALHREVMRLLHQESSVFNQMSEANRMRARDLLERAGVAEGNDVVLKFDLGAVYERLDAFDRLIANPEQVFFVPSYERSWYLGLGAAARARMANDPRMSLVWAQRAEAHFADYVARANARDRTAPVKDRWKSLAEKRLAVAKSERKRIEVKVRTLPKLTLDTEGL